MVSPWLIKLTGEIEGLISMIYEKPEDAGGLLLRACDHVDQIRSGQMLGESMGLDASAALEVLSTRSNHRAFVAVMPPLPEKEISEWRVRKFEIPEQMMEMNFGEDDLADSVFLRLETMEAVEALIAEWGFDSAAFDSPWKFHYPL